MLPKENRLLSGYEFRKIRRNALEKKNFVKNDLFDLYYVTEPLSFYSVRDEAPKIGVLVSKKFSKKAVKRNKVKRLVYNSIRPHVKSLKKDTKIVIFPKQAILERSYEEFSSEITKVLQKISIAG